MFSIILYCIFAFLARGDSPPFLILPSTCDNPRFVSLSQAALACFAAALYGLAFLIYSFIAEVFPAGLSSRVVPNLMERRLKPFRAVRGAAASRNVITALSTARIMVLRRVFGLLMLSLCLGQTTSPTTSPSPTAAPCSAPPGFFCSGGAALICPVGAFCAGGAALNVSCYPVTACTVAGLGAQPPCYWNVSTLAGSGVASAANGVGTMAGFSSPNGIVFGSSDSVLYVAGYFDNALRSIAVSSRAVTTLAGGAGGFVGECNGVATQYLDAIGTSAKFANPTSLVADRSGNLLVCDYYNQRLRAVNTSSGAVSTLAGGGGGTVLGGTGNYFAVGVGAAAGFARPSSIAMDNATGHFYVSQSSSLYIALVTPAGAVSIAAGSGVAGCSNGAALSATFTGPVGLAFSSPTLFVADFLCNTVRALAGGTVTTIAGSGAAGGSDGVGASASFDMPFSLAVDAKGQLYVGELNGFRLRRVTPAGVVTTVAGSGTASYADGFGLQAGFGMVAGIGVSSAGSVALCDRGNHRIRLLTCVPCPASFFCSSGAPVLCPAGSACPLSSINATLCPRGAFAPAGASSCSPCPAGTFTSAAGSLSCQQCPGGHFCPAGTSSWASLNCGRGNYCPDGSSAPTPCPFQVPPTGGWGALQVQGPAFLVDTAYCLNHCFWNFTSGDGMLSKC